MVALVPRQQVLENPTQRVLLLAPVVAGRLDFQAVI